MRNQLTNNSSCSYLPGLFAIVVASFFICVGPALADTPIVACEITVFPLATLPKGLNVRSGPGTEYGVIKVIDDSDVELDVIGSAGKWLHIRRATSVDGSFPFKGDGWVFAPLMGVNANRNTELHADPNKASAVTGMIKADYGGFVQSCAGEWVQVRFENLKGWMPPNSHCGNPVTTCP